MIEMNSKKEMKTVQKWLKLDTEKISPQNSNSYAYINLINARLKGISINSFIEHSGLKITEMAQLLHLSERSLQRYTADKILSKETSERLIEMTRLFQLGTAIFGKKGKFKSWLRRSNRALQGHKPVELIETNIGLGLVEDELNRIKYGVFE